MFKARLYATVLAAASCAIPALAVDGTTLINQSTVMAAGGFPYTISQPGSYRLSGNLLTPTSNAAGVDGIHITAPNVTLDFNGFTLACSTCSTAGNGVTVSASNVSILNGTITAFNSGNGILYQPSSSGRVDHMSLTNNGDGMFTNGPVLITNSSFSGNPGNGVLVNLSAAQISNCIFVANGVGVTVQPSLGSNIIGATVLSSTFFGNQGIGLQMGTNGAYGLNASFGNGALNVSAVGAVSLGNNACGSGTC